MGLWLCKHPNFRTGKSLVIYIPVTWIIIETYAMLSVNSKKEKICKKYIQLHQSCNPLNISEKKHQCVSRWCIALYLMIYCIPKNIKHIFHSQEGSSI